MSLWRTARRTGPAGVLPASVCQPNGAGCTRAGTYRDLNVLINANYGGFRVVWTASVVPAYSSGVPLSWTAYVRYTNMSSSTLVLTCPGNWTSPSNVWEWMSGGSGDDGGAPASVTTCSQNLGLIVTGPPDGDVILAVHTYQSQATYRVSVTGTVLSGNCVAHPFTVTFTLLGYAALGDSYSAGLGADQYLPGTGSRAICSRSYNAYSERVVTALGGRRSASGEALAFVACSGSPVNVRTIRRLRTTS